MEFRICFIYSVSYFLTFVIIPICKANYDAQLALNMKEMDMEYGEKLSSLEDQEGRMRWEMSPYGVNSDIVMRSYQPTTAMNRLKISRRKKSFDDFTPVYSPWLKKLKKKLNRYTTKYRSSHKLRLTTTVFDMDNATLEYLAGDYGVPDDYNSFPVPSPLTNKPRNIQTTSLRSITEPWETAQSYTPSTNKRYYTTNDRFWRSPIIKLYHPTMKLYPYKLMKNVDGKVPLHDEPVSCPEDYVIDNTNTPRSQGDPKYTTKKHYSTKFSPNTFFKSISDSPVKPRLDGSLVNPIYNSKNVDGKVPLHDEPVSCPEDYVIDNTNTPRSRGDPRYTTKKQYSTKFYPNTFFKSISDSPVKPRLDGSLVNPIYNSKNVDGKVPLHDEPVSCPEDYVIDNTNTPRSRGDPKYTTKPRLDGSLVNPFYHDESTTPRFSTNDRVPKAQYADLGMQVKYNGNDLDDSEDSNTVEPNKNHTSRVTRCTTSKPLPKLDPNFLPTSSEESNNTRQVPLVEGKAETLKNLKKYRAPEVAEPPLHYIDDE